MFNFFKKPKDKHNEMFEEIYQRLLLSSNILEQEYSDEHLEYLNELIEFKKFTLRCITTSLFLLKLEINHPDEFDEVSQVIKQKGVYSIKEYFVNETLAKNFTSEFATLALMEDLKYAHLDYLSKIDQIVNMLKLVISENDYRYFVKYNEPQYIDEIGGFVEGEYRLIYFFIDLYCSNIKSSTYEGKKSLKLFHTNGSYVIHSDEDTEAAICLKNEIIKTFNTLDSKAISNFHYDIK